MPLSTSLRDRLIAADPGLTRLYMAARATGAVGIALAILALVARQEHLPLTVPLLGAALGMTWAISVNDRTTREQRATTLLLWLPAAAMLTLGTFTAPHRILSDALFAIVLFFSVYVRRYGPRWFAIGMVSVLAYFFALFLRATFAHLPWLLLALAVTTACTYVLRFYALKDDPQTAFRNAVAAFRARQRLITATIADAAACGTWTRRLQRRLNHHVFRLNETAIALDDLLAPVDAGEQRAAVLDAEMATADAAEAAARDPHAPVDLPVLRISPPSFAAAEWTPRGVFKAGTQIETNVFSATTRQAVQMMLAAIASMIAGELLSPQRWYWAVLTAFVVFSGTTSSGETLRKAWSRVAGTAAGVIAGLVVALLVRGNHAAALTLLFVFLFAGVYGMRLSYAVMTFGITAVLSLLYVLLGYFTDQLMLLRLAETIAGAALGGIAATFVLPIHTEHVVSSVIAEALARLSDAVEKSAARLEGDRTADPLPAVRAYDESFQTARAQLLPLIYSLRIRPDETLRTRLLMLAACGYSLRVLTSIGYEAPAGCRVDEIRTLERRVQQQIKAAIAVVTDGKTPVPADEELPSPAGSTALVHLERIDRAVHRLAASFNGATSA